MTRSLLLAASTLALSPVALSQVGDAYCNATANSTGGPSVLSGVGSPSLILNDLVLRATALPPGVPGYFIASFDQGFVPNPAGSSGNLCLSGAVGRYVDQVLFSSAAGEVEQPLDLASIPQPGGFVALGAGETLNFQFWHRDVSPLGATSNFSRGLSVEFDCATGLLYGNGLVEIGTRAHQVAAADFDGDGLDDIVTLSLDAGTPEAVVLLATGGGEFERHAGYDTVVTQGQLAVGDVNADGFIDFVTADYTGTVRAFPGAGDGSFGMPLVLAGFSAAESLAINDFNGDGLLDFVVGGSFADSSVSIALSTGVPSTGIGAYSSPVEIPVGAPSTSRVSDVVSLDVDADGDQDVVAIRFGLPGSIALLRNNGAGQFSGPVVFAANFPGFAEVGDFDGDGLPDLVLENSFQESVALLLNDGAGGFLAPTPYAAVDEFMVVGQVVVGDLNSDGRPDVVLGTNQDRVAILLNEPSLGLGAPTSSFSGRAASSVALGDFDGDGSQDIADVGTGRRTVAIHLNRREGQFESTLMTEGNGFDHLVAVDFDGDGRDEVVASDSDGRRVRVFGAGGAGASAEQLSTRSTVDSPSALATGDFNQDQLADIAVVGRQADRVWILLGQGTQTLGQRFPVSVGSQPVAIAAGDLNGDGRDDLVTANQGSADVSLVLADGGGGFLPIVSLPIGTLPTSVALGDLDADGDMDLVVGTLDFGLVRIFRNNGSGQFIVSASLTLPAGSGDLEIADLDRDGFGDLVVSSDAASRFHVAMNDGQGGLTAPIDYVLPGTPSQIVSGDIDRDGDIDLSFACETQLVVALNGGGGVFDSLRSYAGGSEPQEVALADLDGDGVLELLAAGAGGLSASLVWLRGVCR